MSIDYLIQARKRAERAVEGMQDGALKTAAFQTILAKLLNDADPGEGIQAASKVPTRKGKQPDTLTGRVLAVKDEGFFKTQRSLGEVREELGSRGWHYPVTTLSGAMQGLVRQRQLRRERVSDGKKRLWKYSNP
jgi:hypothetical protein